MTNDNQIWEQKDKRISFQGLHGHLCQLGGMTENEIWELTKKRNEELYQLYPFPSETTTSAPKSFVGANRAIKSDIKACPKCGKPMNKQFNKKTEKSPDWKCSDNKCKFNFQNGQWVASQYITSAWNDNPKDVARANYQDSVDDESHKQHYQNEHPDQQYGEFGEPL